MQDHQGLCSYGHLDRLPAAASALSPLRILPGPRGPTVCGGGLAASIVTAGVSQQPRLGHPGMMREPKPVMLGGVVVAVQ